MVKLKSVPKASGTLDRLYQVALVGKYILFELKYKEYGVYYPGRHGRNRFLNFSAVPFKSGLGVYHNSRSSILVAQSFECLP